MMDADQIKGRIQNAFGKVEEAVGEAIGNKNLSNAGAEDRVKGSATETWGNVKDTAHSVSETAHTHAAVNEERATNSGDSLRDHIASGTEHLRDSINSKMDNVKDREAERRDDLNRSV